MANQEDWRLTDHEDDMFGVQWVHKPYVVLSATWDHDHCLFCFEKFDHRGQVGYCIKNKNFWVWETCFSDFKDRFSWTVVK